jgi:hypothetical protein
VAIRPRPLEGLEPLTVMQVPIFRLIVLMVLLAAIRATVQPGLPACR